MTEKDELKRLTKEAKLVRMKQSKSVWMDEITNIMTKAKNSIYSK